MARKAQQIFTLKIGEKITKYISLHISIINKHFYFKLQIQISNKSVLKLQNTRTLDRKLERMQDTNDQQNALKTN